METCSTRRQRTASLLAAVIAVHKEHRSLLHSGGAGRFDHANPAVLAHGVVATDGSEALVSFATVTAPASLVIEPFRITGLDQERLYTVSFISLAGGTTGAARKQPVWLETGVTHSGRELDCWDSRFLLSILSRRWCCISSVAEAAFGFSIPGTWHIRWP